MIFNTNIERVIDIIYKEIMADELAPNEPYFNGIIYNSNFFSNDTAVTSSYVNNTFLPKIGNPTSTAGITTFTGDIIANNLKSNNNTNIQYQSLPLSCEYNRQAYWKFSCSHHMKA